MFRSVILCVALLILPGFSSAQVVERSQPVTHEVVKGETLWELAGRYLNNPFRWPMIFEANRDEIQDPHWIYPGQVFVIPALGEQMAEVGAVTVITESGPPTPRPGAPDTLGEVMAAAPGAGALPGPGPGERTVFYQPPSLAGAGTESAVVGMGSVAGPTGEAVPMGLTYSAAWVESAEDASAVVGTLQSFDQVLANRTPQGRALAFERLVVKPEEGVTLRVGDLLQSYVVVRREEGLGRVVRPTGVLTVTRVGEAGPVAMVSAEFDRVRLGQRVRFVPEYLLRPGASAEPVEGGLTGSIVGFDRNRPLQPYGAQAFLDLGKTDGIGVGDEFGVFSHGGGGFAGGEAAILQVVLVRGSTSTARVIGLTDPQFGVGDRVRLLRKMQ